MRSDHLNIGFVSTRFAGTDGVSLETKKWAEVLKEMGHKCFYFAGESDRPDEKSRVVDEAHFKHPTIKTISKDLFDDYRRSPKTTEQIHEIRQVIKDGLLSFLQDFEINIIVAENALSLPMNVPLGLAITEIVAENEISTIAHHHDFTWERSRFAVHAAADYLQAAFPPDLRTIKHVVLNSYAARQLAWRNGLDSTIVPNVMNFETHIDGAPNLADQFRKTIGISKDQKLILQPTRIVPRKQIERSIELVARMPTQDAVLLISHASGDEGHEYKKYLEKYSELLDINPIFASEIIDYKRGKTEDGRRIFSLRDVYHASDLVTYPSKVEGFGNAFVEAVLYKRPIIMSSYEIFQTDIQPKGFEVIAFDQFIRDETIREAEKVLKNPESAQDMVEKNFNLGKKYFSYDRLKECLAMLIRLVRS